MIHADLISLIEKEAAKRGIAPATLCRLAVGNQRLFKNLQAGKSCTLAVMERFKSYIKDPPAGSTPSDDEAA